MKTIHVGGLNPIGRVKTLADALHKANDDDTIILHKNEIIGVTINKNVIIKGEGHTLTVEPGVAGMIVNAPLILENVKFEVGTRANAIVNNSKAILDDVSVKLKGPIREFYPIVVNHGSMEINGGRYTKLESDSESTTQIKNAELYSYYGGDIVLAYSENHSNLNGSVYISNSVLNSTTITGNVHIENTTIGKFVNIDDSEATLEHIKLEQKSTEPSVKLKKEPERGPLENQLSSKYCLKIEDSDVLINEYQVLESNDNFWGIVARNSFVTLQTQSNDVNQTAHKIENSTITFSDSLDQNHWVLDKTTPSFVRSTINTNMNIETAADKLNKMIGLKQVKEQFNTIMNTIKVQQNGADKNYAFSNNFIFAGDPGVGKTTIANIFGEALFEVGAIPENKITKVTVDDLIKGYVGQTASNVRDILDKALGGVVFIDEAYQLSVKNGQNTFNDEALSVLIRYMEDHRDNLVVIAAGYTKEMKEFLASNVGLSRRFQWIEFEDYTAQEMSEIFELVRDSYKDEYDDERLKAIIPALFDKLIQVNLSIPDVNGRVTNGGNGGLVRNVYQQIVQNRNNRVVNGGTNKITKEDIEFGFKQQIQAALSRKF